MSRRYGQSSHVPCARKTTPVSSHPKRPPARSAFENWMSNNRQSENSPEHHEVSSLIPWYVNDTLDGHERQRVDVHVATCAVCREDLAVQNRIFEGMEAQSALDYMPMASLKRLHARLDVAQAQSDSPQASSLDPMRRATPWRSRMAAPLGALALA